jgi:AcrR family transcriptional regulator
VNGPGLRERKKEQTRQTIAEAARRLFTRRGFERVTVAEVARQAEVSVGTVFNYFPTKEDLFFSGMEAFEAGLLEAVRERAAGESALEAFERFVVDQSQGLADRAELIVTAVRILDASPILQARERRIVAESTRALAELIAAETGSEGIEPIVVANALMGAQRALVDHVRGRVLAGLRGKELSADARRQGRRAFARLERGLGGYDVRRRSR